MASKKQRNRHRLGHGLASKRVLVTPGNGYALALACGAVMMACSPAWADGPTRDAPASNASGGAELDEIVVTATKRSEPLSKTPLAVTALSQDQLTAAGVVNLQGLTSAAPSVQMKNVAVNDSIEVTIRGITNNDFNPGGSPAVATYVDGIYLARTQGLKRDLFDAERIEVRR